MYLYLIHRLNFGLIYRIIFLLILTYMSTQSKFPIRKNKIMLIVCIDYSTLLRRKSSNKNMTWSILLDFVNLSSLVELCVCFSVYLHVNPYVSDLFKRFQVDILLIITQTIILRNSLVGLFWSDDLWCLMVTKSHAGCSSWTNFI